MPDQSADIKTRVAALADRLRQAQGNLGATDPTTRSAAVERAIEQELGTIDPAARQQFLAALAASLVSFTSNAQATTQALPPVPTQELQTFLGHGARDRLDAARVVELTRLLAEFAASVDKTVSASWRAIAPNSRIRHQAGVKANMSRFAAGDAAVTRAQMQQELDRLRTLAGGLMSAVERAGEQFAQRHLEKFSPSEIEALSRLIPGALVAIETKCWRKYKELAEHHDKAAIEQDIRDVITEYTEKLIEGLGR